MSDEKAPYKQAFTKIKEEKRQRILETAIEVFAEKGFTGANINIIAAQANVSIGAMYNYFETKADLFLTVTDHLHDVLSRGLMEVIREDMGFFEAIEAMMKAAVEGAITFRNRTIVYLNISAEHIDGLAERLSGKLEGVTLEAYRNLAVKAIESGELPADTDLQALGFLIDNQIVALQRAFASEYDRDRMSLFLDGETDPGKIVGRMMKLIRASAG